LHLGCRVLMWLNFIFFPVPPLLCAPYPNPNPILPITIITNFLFTNRYNWTTFMGGWGYDRVRQCKVTAWRQITHGSKYPIQVLDLRDIIRERSPCMYMWQIKCYTRRGQTESAGGSRPIPHLFFFLVVVTKQNDDSTRIP
jgi:hypothetical protein